MLTLDDFIAQPDPTAAPPKTLLFRIICDLEKDNGTAKRQEVIEQGYIIGLPLGEISEGIEELIRNGDIYQPRHNHFKIV